MAGEAKSSNPAPDLPTTITGPPPGGLPTGSDVPTVLGPSPGPVSVYPELGQSLGDYEILRVLGEGAFARVFLARQVSLDRQVALKVTAHRGNEARTLASLEHDHIVRVFSETVDPQRKVRLLCMQYVPGSTLERVIAVLAQRDPRTRNGQTILEAIDLLSTDPGVFDPAALRDREFLSHCDFTEAVCWLGARLALALAHAHAQGILHRDIKPANILLNRYGRPMLADFNIALDSQRDFGPRGEVFGGTLSYMSPEHLDAFNPEIRASAALVNERSDIYSLGVVLFEMLTGQRPFLSADSGVKASQALKEMARERRCGAPSLRQLRPEVSEILERIVRRCLDPDPARRYDQATELARALEGCHEHQRIVEELPAPTLLPWAAFQHPFLLMVFLTLLPHLLGSVVNITYNSVRIADDLTAAQQATFLYLVLGYNLLVYPFALGMIYHLVSPIYRILGRLAGPEIPDEEQVTTLRRQALRLPWWAIGLSCLGWLPGGILFPLGLHWLAGPIAPEVFGHFLVSFTLSGLIALTYSYFAVQYVVLRLLYPFLWVDAQGIRRQAQDELGSLGRWSGLFQLFAGLIPLAGAALLVGVGPTQFTLTFRILVTALITLGMVGFGAALLASRQIYQTLNAFSFRRSAHRDETKKKALR